VAVSTNPKFDRLYCVAIEVYSSTGIMVDTRLEYLHADCAEHAKRIYRQSEPDFRRFRIASAGKVIAYKVHDKEGLILSV
jgi:hypothetical protein